MTKTQFVIFAVILLLVSSFAFYQGTKLYKPTDKIVSSHQGFEVTVIASSLKAPVLQILPGNGILVCQMTEQIFEKDDIVEKTIARYKCNPQN